MLVVFDVDGTLTATAAVDAGLYAQAFAAVFGKALPTTDWTEYSAPSDRGVAEEAVRRLQLDPRRIPELEERFVEELTRALVDGGAEPVPGAARVLDELAAAGHDVAVATGAWQRSARAKLAAAGIHIGDRVLVGSDVHPAREEIVREAVRLSGTKGRTVFVGDGLWDLRTARTLRMPFVGVDAERTGALRQAGVFHVVEDYRDVAAFISALGDATIP